MKKFDVIIVAAVVIVAAVLYAGGIFSPKDEGNEVVIYIDKDQCTGCCNDQEITFDLFHVKGLLKALHQ